MTTVFGTDRRFTAVLSGRDGAVIVGDTDITKSVRGFRLDAHAGEPSRVTLDLAVVTLDLAVVDVTKLDADRAEVTMPVHTRDLLIAAGWTPPADDAAAVWVIEKRPHDEDVPAAPAIMPRGTIIRTTGHSDAQHARTYAAQLLAAADESDRRTAAHRAAAAADQRDASQDGGRSDA